MYPPRFWFCDVGLLRRERIPAVHRAVAEPEVRAPAQGPEARLRHDLDEETAGIVALGRKLIARDVHGLDLRLRRQVAAFEAVDPDDGVGSGHLHQLTAHLGGILRQQFDLLARERRAEERHAIGGRLLTIARDRHRIRQSLQRAAR